VHDVRPHRHVLPAPAETFMLKQMYARAGHLIVLHDVLKEEIVADFDVNPEYVHVVPHVLDANVSPRRRAAAPRRPTLLFFGALRANKGVDPFVNAVAQLGNELAADVIVAGAGDEVITTMVKQRIGSLPHVHLEFGRIDPQRRAELFASASWCVLPYRSFHS